MLLFDSFYIFAQVLLYFCLRFLLGSSFVQRWDIIYSNLKKSNIRILVCAANIFTRCKRSFFSWNPASWNIKIITRA